MTSFMFFMMHQTTTGTTTSCEENEVCRKRENEEKEIDSLTDTQTLEIQILLPNSSNVEKEKRIIRDEPRIWCTSIK
jgi:hypothetical protein